MSARGAPSAPRGGGVTSFLPPAGRRPSIEWVPPAELEIDPSYQRSIEFAASRRQIAKIAHGWDWDLCGMLLVSRRPDDRLFVVDGQHRLAAARLRGDIDMLPCCTTRRSGPADEARLFIAANRTRRSVPTLDDFHAAVAADDPECVRLFELVEAAGLKVARHYDAKGYGPNEIGAIAGLRRAMVRYGEAPVAAALTVIGEAFPDERLVNAGTLLQALVEIKAGYELDADRLFETLLARTTSEWSSLARLDALTGGKQRAAAMKEAILSFYRSRRAAA